MRLTTVIEKHEYTTSYLAIFLVVTVANLYNVYGLDMLFLDDNARYFFFVNDQYKIYDPRSFIGLALVLKWVGVAIFSTYSIETARLFILIVYMAPLSCLFYYFNRKILNLSMWVSLGSAVVVNIIPSHVMPMFLDGSYPIPGLLVLLGTLIFTAKFLDSNRVNVVFLVVASAGWLLTCDLIGEMGIFMFPVLLYYVHSSNAEFKRKLYLYIPTLIITGLRLYKYYQTVGVNPSNKPVALSILDIAGRFSKTIQWWSPYGSGTVTAIIVGMFIALILALAYKKSRNPTNRVAGLGRAYIFYGIWFLSCSSPFWFLSKYFGPRYFYISYFALTTMVFMAIYQLVELPVRYRQRVAAISLIAIFSFYGVQRYTLNANLFARYNRMHANLDSLLANETINSDTQIALVNLKNGTGGYFMWSSGYLQYLLKKPGIRGIMGNEMNFYDPFNMAHCGYTYKMSCLDVSKELVAYKKNSEHKVSRMTYFLRWNDAGKRTSEWSLFSTGKDNKLSIVDSGVGLDDYVQTASDLNLLPEQILWGDFKNKLALDALM